MPALVSVLYPWPALYQTLFGPGSPCLSLAMAPMYSPEFQLSPSIASARNNFFSLVLIWFWFESS